MTDDIGHEKRALRAEIRERRRTRTQTERAHDQTGLTAQLIELIRRLGATYISAYLSTPDEPDTREFLDWACAHGIRVLVPISRVDGLLDWAHYDGGEEDEDHLGMPSPTSELLGPIAVGDVDLIITPAACVDHSGMRMGWGRGYFDKTLGSMQKRPPVYAVIFDCELIDEVPSEIHDQRVDGAITPSSIVVF